MMDNTNVVKKPCIKCLLAELDNEKLLKDVQRAIALMNADEKASDELYENRLSVCKGCNYLNEGTCNACGCYVELRAASVLGKCPYKKW